MRSVLFLIALVLNLILFSCKEKDPVIPPVSEIMMPTHPRILWGTDEEQAIKSAIAVSGSWQKSTRFYFGKVQ